MIDALDQGWLRDAHGRAAKGRKLADVPCPLCASQSTRPRKRVLRIWDKGFRFTFNCQRCGAHGPDNGDEPPRARTAEEQAEIDRRRAENKATDERERQESIARAQAIWNASLPIAGTAGEAWLAGRGIEVSRVPGDLRFHPKCPYEGNEPELPSFITRYTDVVTGEPLGVRRRAILPGHKAKTRGPQKSCVVRLHAVVGETLCLAEGIETALFATTRLTLHGKVPQPMWASGNAQGMKDFPVLPGVKVLMLLADNDASGTGQSVAKTCADRWVAAGRTVMIVTPRRPADKATFDFNDLNETRTEDRLEIADLVDIEVLAPEAKPATDGGGVSANEARDTFEAVLADFQLATDAATEEDFPVQCVKLTTGGGKTRMTAAAFAKDIITKRALGTSERLLYCVPTHRLGEEIAGLFREQGLTAVVIRGRDAVNPETEKPMCSWLDQVRLAIAAGLNVEESCCKDKRSACPFHSHCAYQRQFGKKADVVIVAHQTLFHSNEKLRGINFIVVDEDFWAAGVRISKEPLPIAEIEDVHEPPIGVEITELTELRKRLAKIIRMQEKSGGLKREYLSGITAEDCSKAIKLEWGIVNKITAGISPGMTKTQIEEISSAILPWIRTAHRINTIWYAVREMLEKPEVQASGRIAIDVGKQRVKLRGLKEIAKQWRVPTLIMSATLPRMDILWAFFDTASVAAEIDVAMPHARITQVIGAPVAQSKLKADLNRRALKRLILAEWMRTGRQQTLVVAQKDFADWLRKEGLPATISVEHLNAIEGLDQYKAARCVVVIGRTMPPPESVEAMAGALTGAEPALAPVRANGSSWYPKVTRHVRLKEGIAHPVECEEHSDPVAEAVRWQICEGELVQAIGRARGVNRTPADPVDITIVADVVLPLSADEVRPWRRPSAAIEMAAQGVMLFSRTDMARAFPELWNERATDKVTKDDLVSTLAAFAGLFKDLGAHLSMEETAEVSTQILDNIYTRKWVLTSLFKGLGAHLSPILVEYTPTGSGQRPRRALFDARLVPDPKTWLSARVGELAKCDVFVPSPNVGETA